jgi:hydroxymethylpyrimidine/phosphomethylpyrimidine kinase
MRIAMTIAGSDSGGGAGIQADLKTFAAHRVHGTSAITAVTAQNSSEVRAWVALEPRMVVAQIEAVAEDMPVAAVKTGMLASAEIVTAVADTLARLGLPGPVVDPVMVAKSGDRLLDRDCERAYLSRLMPLAVLVTPNLPEAEALLGRSVRSLDDMRLAARDLCALGARAVVVKGGHLEGEAVDVYFDGERLEELRAPRIDTPHTHGTGCTFSAAIAARLALGDDLLTAVRGAKEYLTEAIRRAYPVGRGHGPVDHLHPLTRGCAASSEGAPDQRTATALKKQ